MSRVSCCQPLHQLHNGAVSASFLMPRKGLMPVHGNFSDEIKTDAWHKTSHKWTGISRTPPSIH